MEKPKVCLGCFAEWDRDDTECKCCGWTPERAIEELLGWKQGMVLGRRYLVGAPFYSKGDVVVWRAYDNILGVPCFAMKIKDASMDTFRQMAAFMEAAKNGKGKELEILSLKKINQEYVLFFSLKDRYMSEALFESLLLPEEKLEERKADTDSEEAESETKVENEAACEAEPEAETKAEKAGEAEKGSGLEKILSTGTLLNQQYRVVECIGIGGFGITYLCEDEWLGRKVAVKEYFPADWAVREENYVSVKQSNMVTAFRYGMQSFMKEIQIAAKFIHTPHIVTLFDGFQENDSIYMVMNFIDGVSIGRQLRMREYKPFTPKETAEVIFPVLDALEDIHEKKIIHSDISPGNIMRTATNEIYLIDLGAAKYNLDSQPQLSAAFLKIDYSAPEQYRTAKEGVPKGEGPWTDIYGIGATMYYMLTGHKPTDVISRLNGKDTDLVEPKKYKVKLKKKWMKLIRHAMALDKKDRIASAKKLKKKISENLKDKAFEW